MFFPTSKFSEMYSSVIKTSIRKLSVSSMGNSAYNFRGVVRKPMLNWKIVTGFFAAGSYLAYSDYVFEKYSEYTSVDENDEVLPIRLDFKLRSLPLYQSLAHSPKSRDWVKLSSWENLDRNVFDAGEKILVKDEIEYKVPTLTNHTLAKPGGFLVKPVIFYNTETDETVTIVHMGYKLCGYPFIVHGGIIATLLNETFKRNSSLSSLTSSSLKEDFKVESLSITYKLPLFANQFFVIKTKVEKSDRGKKELLLRSVIESEKGKPLVESVATLRNTGRATKRANESQASKWAIF